MSSHDESTTDGHLRRHKSQLLRAVTRIEEREDEISKSNRITPRDVDKFKSDHKKYDSAKEKLQWWSTDYHNKVKDKLADAEEKAKEEVSRDLER